VVLHHNLERKFQVGLTSSSHSGFESCRCCLRFIGRAVGNIGRMFPIGWHTSPHAGRTRIQNRKRTKGELRINDFASSYKSTSLKHVSRIPAQLDGFNESWIAFEGGEGGIVKGKVTLETVLRALVLAAR
jgi:hypothetical protein